MSRLPLCLFVALNIMGGRVEATVNCYGSQGTRVKSHLQYLYRTDSAETSCTGLSREFGAKIDACGERNNGVRLLLFRLQAYQHITVPSSSLVLVFCACTLTLNPHTHQQKIRWAYFITGAFDGSSACDRAAANINKDERYTGPAIQCRVSNWHGQIVTPHCNHALSLKSCVV